MSFFISYKNKETKTVGPDGQEQMTKRKYYGLFFEYTLFPGEKPRNTMVTGLGYLDEEFSEPQKEALKTIILDMVVRHSFPYSSDERVNAKAEEFYRNYLERSEGKHIHPIDLEAGDEHLKRLQEKYLKEKKFEEGLSIDVKNLKVCDSRSVGAEMICLETMRRLKLQQFLQEDCDFNELDAKVAVALIVTRCIYPYSELRMSEILQTESSICELLGIDPGIMNKDRLYRMAKRLSDIRDRLEFFLRNTVSNSLFSQDEEQLVIMDCTNTYFEGRMEHAEICQFGRSKEKRTDCKIAGIALVVNNKGIVVRSKVIPGNTQDVKVLKGVINVMGFTPGDGRIVVMDCGFASISNLKFLKENGYDYVTVMRAGNTKKYQTIGEPVRQETDNGNQSISLQKIDIEYPTHRAIHWESIEFGGQTLLIDVNSRDTVALKRKFKAYSDKLDGYQAGIQGRGAKKKDKLMKKLLKLEVENPEIHKCFNISVSYNDQDIATSLTYDFDQEKAEAIILAKAKKYTPEEAEDYQEEHEIFEDNVLIVESHTKELKEKSMLDLEMDRFKKGLDGLALTIEGTKPIKGKAKFHQSLGALMKNFPHAAKCYDVAYEFDEEERLKSLTYQVNEENMAAACGKHGKYLLRTSIDDLDERTTWKYYNIIRTVEESFKVLKSDLHLRPNYHKFNDFVIAHINLSILAYWVVSVINHKLRENNYRVRWDRLSAAAKGLQRVTVMGKMPKKNLYVQVRINEECPSYLTKFFEILGVNYTQNRKTKFIVEPVVTQNLYPPLFTKDRVL